MFPDIVQLHLPYESHPLPPRRQNDLCNAIAKICDTQPDDVQIVAHRQEHGLWVAVRVPSQFAFRITRASGQAAVPLWSAFQDVQASLLPLNQTGEKFAPLQPEDEILLRLLYLGAKQIMVRAEFGGGYSGARVLLIEPIDQANRTLMPQIAKLASVEEITREQERYTQYVDDQLPRITPRLKNRQAWEKKAGLCYDFVNGGVLGRTKTLEKFYQAQTSTEPIIQTLSDLLVKELGDQWYRQSSSLMVPFADAYGGDLVEHLLISIRPASSDGIWLRGREPALDNSYQRVDSDTIRTLYADIAPGTFIQISGLVMAGTKGDVLRLHYPDKPDVVIKVQDTDDIDCAPTLALHDTVVVRGEVRHNRQARLEAIVLDAFFNYEAFALEKQALQLETLQWVGGELVYPNPLRHYTAILNTILRGRQSLVHGDLHLRNILVDETGRSYLIDFALVAERHNLFDFIKLETYIRQMILSQHEYSFSFKEYLQFEELLTANSLATTTVTPPSNAELGKAYAVITALRKLAAFYMPQPPDWRGEYLSALFLYNLVVLKYHENHGRQATRLAFGTAAVLLKSMLLPSHPPPAPPPIDPPLGDKEPQIVRDRFTGYEIRIKILLTKVGSSHPEYLNVLSYQERLQSIINRTRIFGETRERESQRLEVLYELDRVCLAIFGHPFHALGEEL